MGKVIYIFLFFLVEEVERLKCFRDHFNVFSFFLFKYIMENMWEVILLFFNISFADRLPRRLPLPGAHLD